MIERPVGNAFDKYGSRNPVVRRLMSGFFTALDEAVGPQQPARVLEVGVGEGNVSRRLAARWPVARIVGVDLPDGVLAESWSEGRLHGCFGDGGHLPIASGSVDLVLAIEVLEHVDDPDRVLQELRRVATPDARFVLSVPEEPIWRVANLARGRYVRSLGNTPGHIQHWSRKDFVRLVSGQLRVERVWHPFPWTVVSARLPG